MPSSAEWVEGPGGRSVLDLLREMYAATQPGSKTRAKYQADVARIVMDGIKQDLRDGIDHQGKQVAPIKESTRQWRVKKYGARSLAHKPRVPRGDRSRFITSLIGKWTENRADVMTYSVTINLPFAKFHQTGTKRMPARRVGYSPRIRQAITERHARLADDIRKGGR